MVNVSLSLHPSLMLLNSVNKTKMRILPITETRPFFVEQSKSGRWNVWVFQREMKQGYKYSVQQSLKHPDDAYSWGLRYINTVSKSY